MQNRKYWTEAHHLSTAHLMPEIYRELLSPIYHVIYHGALYVLSTPLAVCYATLLPHTDPGEGSDLASSTNSLLWIIIHAHSTRRIVPLVLPRLHCMCVISFLYFPNNVGL